jgi:hypothetical protein
VVEVRLINKKINENGKVEIFRKVNKLHEIETNTGVNNLKDFFLIIKNVIKGKTEINIKATILIS